MHPGVLTCISGLLLRFVFLQWTGNGAAAPMLLVLAAKLHTAMVGLAAACITTLQQAITTSTPVRLMGKCTYEYDIGFRLLSSKPSLLANLSITSPTELTSWIRVIGC